MLRPSCFMYNISLENNLLHEILKDSAHTHTHTPHKKMSRRCAHDKLLPRAMLLPDWNVETKKHKTEQKLFPENYYVSHRRRMFISA
jgi:hypothetical protein